MVRQIKRKFITISMFATTLVLFVIIGSINIMNYFHIDKTTDSAALSIPATIFQKKALFSLSILDLKRNISICFIH